MDDPFGGMQNQARRSERYRKVAAEYSEWAKDASSPFVRPHYRRVAEEYRLRAEGQLMAQQHAERIKDLVEQLKAKNGAEALEHAASTPRRASAGAQVSRPAGPPRRDRT